MTTVNTSTTAANDAQIRNHGAVSWASLLDGSGGTKSINTTIDDFANFAYADGTAADRYCDRCLFEFDLSAIPPGATVTSARLRLYVTGKSSAAGGSMGVTAASHASPPTTADWTNVSSTEYATRVNFSSFTTSAYNDLTFNSTGLAAISAAAGGTLKLATRSSFDIDASGPGASSYSQAYGRLTDYTGTGSDPILEVTYSPDATITAPALAVAVTNPTTQAHGNILDSFTDTNDVNLESHAGESGAWTRLQGSNASTKLKITSNRAYCYDTTAGPSSATYVNTNVLVGNGAVEVPMQVLSAVGYAGVWFRRTATYLTGAGDGYLAVLDGGAWSATGYVRLIKVYSGTTTELGSYNLGSLSGTYTVKLEAVGSALKVYVDGTERISTTDSAITSGYVGLSMNSATAGTWSAVGIQPTGITLTEPQVTVTSPALAVSAALPAPVVTATSPSVTVTAVPLAVAVTQPAVTVNTRLTISTSGSPTTRSADSATVTVLTAGTAGTSTAHYAFPTGLEMSDGTLKIICRRGTTHASYDGVPVVTTSSDGGSTWGSESLVSTLNISGEDFRSGTMKRLANGTIGFAYFTRRASIFPSDVYTDGYRAYFAIGTYNSSSGSLIWASPVRITGMTNVDDETNALEDFVQLNDGTILAIFCGVNRGPQDTYFKGACARSTDGGATWTDGGIIANGTTYSAGVVEPRATVLANGKVYVAFHIENAPDSGGGQTTYHTTSTTTAATAWTTPASLFTGGTNVTVPFYHPDGDIVHAYSPVSNTFYFKTSYDDGASYGSAVTISGTIGVFDAVTWPAPFAIATAGVSPDLGIAFSRERGDQTRGSLYYREFTRGSSAQSFGGVESHLDVAVTLPAPSVSTTIGGTSVTVTVPATYTAWGQGDVYIQLRAPTVTATSGATGTAVPLAVSVALPTPAVTTTVGMPPASVTVAATPNAVAVTLPRARVVITGPGIAIVLHPEGMVPGTTIGAYRRWEWKGPVAAKLNAGPGTAVDATTVDDDLTATFTLEAGEYVAYAPAYPTRRLFFMVTE